MTILDKIVEKRRKEVETLKERTTIKGLEASPYFATKVVSFKKYILRADKTGIIAEFKRNSPSKGPLNPYASVEKVTIGYMQAGASALSILTESSFFHGKNQDLTEARQLNFCPILRKDFIVEEWQVIETKSIGADVILLIASILKPEETRNLAKLAKELGLEVLLEVHDQEEFGLNFNEYIDLVGVNNRNLKTFETTIETSLSLADFIPKNVVKISESGLDDILQLETLYKAGFQGFLIGEKFMKSSHPEVQALSFMKSWMARKEQLLAQLA
jgi:indole-3-glycerol phosphate synthase